MADDQDAPPAFTTKTFTGKLPPDPELAAGGTAGADDDGEASNSGKPRDQKEEGIPSGANLPEPYNFWPEFGAPRLPEGLLPERIETFARGASLALGADIGGIALAALAVVAAAINDIIQIRVMPYTNWLEAARLWIALVGGPSTKKTPIINAACAPLRQEDNRLWGLYSRRKEAWDTLEKHDRLLTPEPTKERLIIGDMTTEAAQEAFKTSERGLLALYDELSAWFGAMDRYDHGNRNAYDRAFMLQAYQGGPYHVDRVQRGSAVLKNLSLTILGGIQPDLIRKVSKTASDDGLIQRLTPIMLRPAGVAISNSQALADMESFAVLIPQLIGLQPPKNTDHLLKFDPRAQDIQRELAEEHRLLVRGLERFNGKLSTALGKQDALFARLCVVWHAVDHAEGDIALPPIVSEDTASRVATFMRKFTRPHLSDFYEETLGLPEEHERLKAIAGFILSKGLETLANRDIQAGVKLARNLTSKEITQVLEQVELMGWLFRGAPLRFGAPPVWNVNPLVHEHFGKRAQIETERREKIRKLLEQKFSALRHPNDEEE